MSARYILLLLLPGLSFPGNSDWGHMGSNSITREKRTPSKIEGQSRGKVWETPPNCSWRISGAWLSHVCKETRKRKGDENRRNLGAIPGQLADGAIQYRAIQYPIYFYEKHLRVNRGQLADGVGQYFRSRHYSVLAEEQIGSIRDQIGGKLRTVNWITFASANGVSSLSLL